MSKEYIEINKETFPTPYRNVLNDFMRGWNACLNSILQHKTVRERHGQWLPIVIQESYFDPPYCDTCKCSLCGYEIVVSETVYNYCPECGAKIDRNSDNNVV